MAWFFAIVFPLLLSYYIRFLSNSSCSCTISFNSIISLLMHLLILVALHPLTIPVDVINMAILLSNAGLRGYNLLCLGSFVKILNSLGTVSGSRRGGVAIDLIVI